MITKKQLNKWETILDKLRNEISIASIQMSEDFDNNIQNDENNQIFYDIRLDQYIESLRGIIDSAWLLTNQIRVDFQDKEFKGEE